MDANAFIAEVTKNNGVSSFDVCVCVYTNFNCHYNLCCIVFAKFWLCDVTKLERELGEFFIFCTLFHCFSFRLCFTACWAWQGNSKYNPSLFSHLS